MRAARLASLAVLCGAAAAAAADTCPSGHDHRRQDLTDRNFSRLDLRQACFQGATLDGAQFVGSDLDGARFDGARAGASRKGPASFSLASLRSASFAQARLGAVDFQYADLTCTDFSGADLTAATVGPRPRIDGGYADANRCRTKLVKATLRLEQFPIAVWRWADLSDARLPDLQPDTVSLEGADLSDVVFQGAALAGFNLRKAKLDRADLTRANLHNACLDGATLTGVRLPHARMDFAGLIGANLSPSGERKADLSGADLRHAVLDGALLTSATLRGADLAGASLRCAQVEDRQRCADLSKAVLEASRELDAATLVGADLSGASLEGAALNGVSFEDATLLGTVFDGTTIANAVFTGANLAGASFRKSATLSGVNFYNAGLQNARFDGATLTGAGETGQGVDLSCAHLGGADFTNARILRARFLDAVMPPEELCCPQVGQTRYCGTVQADGSAYGPTLRPALSGAVICPNGEEAVCQGAAWLIPEWRTSDCNPVHAVQTVWRPPDCSHDHHGDAVEIKDAGLKKCLQRAFLHGRDEPITKELAASVTRVRCPDQGIADAAGLEAFENLVQLDLSGNALAGAVPIEGLKRLQVLKLADNAIGALDLSKMTGLIALDLSGNPLETLGGMVSLYLKTIELSGTALTDGTKLRLGSQTDLFFADLTRNGFGDLGNLSRLDKLSRLYLAGNDLAKLDGVGQLACPKKGEAALEFVSLSCNPKLHCASVDFGKCARGLDLAKHSGCGRNDSAECGAAAAPVADLPACVPATEKVGAAVYVSSAGKDEIGCGASPRKSCATIAAGIAACQARGAGCGVLVEHGAYRASQTLDLVAGVSVFGGCFFDGAPSAGGPWYSLIEADAAAQPALRAAAVSAPATVRGFLVVAGSPASSGAASVAMQAQDSPGLVVSHVKLVAGNGAPGAEGAPGSAGHDGGPGGSVGGRNQSGGSAGAAAACAGAAGGRGADPAELSWRKCNEGGCSCSFPACGCASYTVRQGESGGPGDAGEWASGGKGQPGKGYLGCPATPLPDSGGVGSAGKNGPCGPGGKPSSDLFGSFAGGAWTAGRGARGTRGGDAGGGAGGGSGGPCDVPCGVRICPGNLFSGQAGGGGGAGGCGAAPGDGGQMGGASLPLVLLRKAPRLDSAVVVAASGGDGGRGGAGQRGGGGGAGGNSYSYHVCDGFDPDNATGAAGGAGGRGGDGGASGGGAGGNGGPAIGVALAAGAQLGGATLTFYPGRGGDPGEGADGGARQGECSGGTGKKGAPGAAVDQHDFGDSQAGTRAEAPPDRFPKPPPRPAVEERTIGFPSLRPPS